MKSFDEYVRNFPLALAVALAPCLGNQLWAAPSIQTIEVTPAPLRPGQNCFVTATASADAVSGTATVDFRPLSPTILRIPLGKQGVVWKGEALLPPDLRLPLLAKATAKVLFFDAGGHRAEKGTNAIVGVASIAAVFAGGILTITGDNQDNTLIASRDATGNILVNGGAIPVAGGVPTVSNTSLIRIFGLGGNDNLTVEEFGGPMPRAKLFGGDGDDTLNGGPNDDDLDGGEGNDILMGRGGNDRLFGGPGNDTLIGGRGNDSMFGGEGDDQFVWNPGDGSDVLEGDAGQDTLLFSGSNISEMIDLSANGNRFRFTRNVANITMDCDGIERVNFRALGGADQIVLGDLSATQVKDVIINLSSSANSPDGQPDIVVVNGTDADDHITVTQSDAGTSILGLRAAVTLIGSDPTLDKLLINGIGGADTVDFVGTDEDESVSFVPDGQAVQFFSNPGNLIAECRGFDTVNFHALKGQDSIVVNDLTGTEVTRVGIDLSGDTAGVGDGAADTIVVNGSDTNDVMTVVGTTNFIEIVGLAATVSLQGVEHGLDTLLINGRNGDDVIDASGVQAGVLDLTMNGGQGNDTLIGGRGNDLLIGGPGNDTLLGGPGDDRFIWNPGDGSDVIEGQAGLDTLVFNGSNIAETIDMSANGQRLRFTRNIANIAMDCDGVENVQFAARGGADNITVNDLSGTSVTNISIDLAGIAGSGIGDGQADTVTVLGTQNADVAVVDVTSAGVTVHGLAATVSISGSEPSLDRLVLMMLGGDDVVEATALPAGLITLVADGGSGDDILIGSTGADIFFGGEGDDILEGGPGLDALDGGPGNNVIIQ